MFCWSLPATLCEDGAWLIKQENTLGKGLKPWLPSELGDPPMILCIGMGFPVAPENGLCTLITQYNFRDFCGLFFFTCRSWGVFWK